jgi:ABC-type transport system involved in multi-copper enzyme maturation permease subunit
MGENIMRFAALVKKELREALPWAVLAMVIFVVIGILNIGGQQRHWWNWEQWNVSPNKNLNVWNFSNQSPLYEIGPLLMLLAPALGIALGARQFWLPFFARTWAFTFHRSVSRSTIVWSKIVATLIVFTVSLVGVWLLFYAYASTPGRYPFPPSARTLIHGFFFIIIGFAAYLAMALTSIGTTKWYTTRLMPIAFTFLVSMFIVSMSNLVLSSVILAATLALLLTQLIGTFNNRQF